MCEVELMLIPEEAVWVFSKHYDRNEKLTARLFFDIPQAARESTTRNKSEIRISHC
jgi:hypothetical protein